MAMVVIRNEIGGATWKPDLLGRRIQFVDCAMIPRFGGGQIERTGGMQQTRYR